MTKPIEKKKYESAIRELIPINELPVEAQNEFIKKADLLELKKNNKVFKQGARDNYSYYLLEGEIELKANRQVHSSIIGTSDQSNYPMAQLQPRQFTGIAKVKSVVLRIDRNAVDKILVMHQGQGGAPFDFDNGLQSVEIGVSEGDEDEGLDWMSRMLQSELFASMPTSNIHQLFSLLEPIEYKAGTKIITQGETGQHYYIIQEGHCEVLRQVSPGTKEIKLAELKAGDGFGEEALITETTRNASVRMLNDGVVARLSKDDFVSLIQKSTLKTVSAAAAVEIISQGGKWLDVRFTDEHEKSTIDGSLHIPLNILRLKADKLDSKIHYVLFCDTGGRSSTASFLLAERGFSISYLDGGLVNHPELAPPEEVTGEHKIITPAKSKQTAPEKKATTPVKKAPAPAKSPAAVPEKKADTPVKPAPISDKKPDTPQPKTAPAKQKIAATADKEMDPEIKATVLEAELTRTNLQIEQAKKQDQSVKQNQEAAKKLEQARAKIEKEKKSVEDDVRKMREVEQTRLKQLEQETEKRMQKERKSIEDIYTRNAEEMGRLEKMKQEAEEQLKAERQRIEREAEEAIKSKRDAEKIRQDLEAARNAMEEESKQRQLEQEEMRKKIEKEAREQIERERRKLAEQIAKNNQEVEEARKEKALAEVARAAAKKEAQAMIEEYKSQQEKSNAEATMAAAKKEAEAMIEEYKLQHEKSKGEDDLKIQEERKKLEEDQQKIRDALKDIQRAKDEASILKRSALAEVAALKAKKKQENAKKNASITLNDQLINAEAKLAKASENEASVEKDKEKAVVAQKHNKEDLKRKQEQEAVLAKQLQTDLEDFKQELAVEEKENVNLTSHLDHMKRIKKRAETAKKTAADANKDLLSEISSQLNNKK